MSLTAIKNLMGDENVEVSKIDGSADIILENRGTSLNFANMIQNPENSMFAN